MSASLVLTGVSGPVSGLSIAVDFDPALLSYNEFSLGGALAGNRVEVTAQSGGRLDIRIAPAPALTRNGTLLVLSFGVLAQLNDPRSALVLANSTLGSATGESQMLRPTADAGIDQYLPIRTDGAGHLLPSLPDVLDPAHPKAWVTLDGRESHDANSPPRDLSYAWTVLTTLAIRLSNAASATPTFATTLSGVYDFALTVSNGLLPSRPSKVRVVIDDGGCLPTADPRVLDPATGQRSEPGREPQPFQASGANITLDASSSAPGNPLDTGRLRFLWRQTQGPSVGLSPSATAAQPVFFPAVAGLYEFELQAIGTKGCESEAKALRLVVRDPGDTVPGLALQASASTTTDVGDDLGDSLEIKLARSLRVTIPARVTLKAVVTDPDVGTRPLRQRLNFEWSQVSGPAVQLTTPALLNTESLVSTVEFEPTTSRVHVLRCVVSELDSDGSPTGIRVSRDLRVIVDSPDNVVPEAQFEVFEEPSGKLKGSFSAKGPNRVAYVAPRTVVRLDASKSSARTGNSGVTLRYTWTQTSGPQVTLSNPYSLLTTFVTPAFSGSGRLRYVFQLYVDSGRDRSEPAAGTLDVASTATREAGLQLGRGLNLVSLPVLPTTTAGGFSLGELMRITGGRFVAACNASRFRVLFPGAEADAEPVRPNVGYVLSRFGAARSARLVGLPWAESMRPRARALVAGLNLIGYPHTAVPADFDAEALRRLTGASFVTRLGIDATGLGRHEVYLPGITSPFAVDPGGAYLLSVPAERPLTLPT
ncbi:MAG: hypothetical protein HY303_03080, partial [Candidatus Wallbacteria bacterium]|nr:hypothetical protein [Candidatus Wallbacteria bacterium]